MNYPFFYNKWSVSYLLFIDYTTRFFKEIVASLFLNNFQSKLKQ